MGWTRVAANGGMGLEEQWIFRPKAAPLCSLKESEPKGAWIASLLNLTGISAVVLHTSGSLETAQRSVEKELRLMGWEW